MAAAAAAACGPVGERTRHGTDRCRRDMGGRKSESGARATFSSLKHEPKGGEGRGAERRRRVGSDGGRPRCPLLGARRPPLLTQQM